MGIFLKLRQDLQLQVGAGQGLERCSVKPTTVQAIIASRSRMSTWGDELSNNIPSRCKRVLKISPWCFPNNQHDIKINLVPSVQLVNNTAICMTKTLKIE